MRTDRPYRKALSEDVALAELLANTHRQFDPKIVDALIDVVKPPPQQAPAAENPAPEPNRYTRSSPSWAPS